MKKVFFTLFLCIVFTFNSKAYVGSSSFFSNEYNSRNWEVDFLTCEDQAFIIMIYIDSIYEVDGFTLGEIWQTAYYRCMHPSYKI